MLASATVTSLRRLIALFVVALAAPRPVAALETAPIVGTATCVFDSANPLCATHDWNDDAAVTAADIPGYLRFTSVASDEVRVSENAAAVTLRSHAATARLDKFTGNLTLGDAAGTGLTNAGAPSLKIGSGAEPLQHLRDVQRTARGIALTADAGTLTVEWSIEFPTARSVRTCLHPAAGPQVTRVVSTVRAVAGEHFYGLTERSVDNRGPSEIAPGAVGSLDRRGETVTMLVTPTISLYTPFFHSSRGYGAYVEGTMTGTYDLAKTDSATVKMDFEFNRRTNEHSLVYFVGDHDAILDEYTALTGRPFVPPRWGFRHLRWRDEHRIDTPAQLDGVEMNADLVNDITMYEALGIPPGNYEFDRPWTSGDSPPPPFISGYAGFASFTFDPERFPNTDKMLAALTHRGYHIFVFGAPWALGEFAADAHQFGYYAPRSSILIDYTNPAAAAWWTGKVQTLIDRGISGIKLDRSEFDITELPDAVPNRATDVFADGRNGREMINGYTIDYARVHYNAFADKLLSTDFVHYLRAGYAGSQQYGIFWGGDSTGRNAFGIGEPTDLGLRAAIVQLAHVAFMGFPIWGSDTGGYYQFGDRDVFARWIEFSAFCPLMEIGGGNQGGGQHAPWSMPPDGEPDAEMIDIYRRFVTLHHELVPLFYSLALDAHTSGRPLARPLVFDFPDDPVVGNLFDEFLLGHDLLFAPLWHVGDRTREVYLPRGTWIDYFDPSHRIDGPATITAPAPLGRIPLYVRAGGIIPLDVTSDVNGNGSKTLSDGRLTLDVYPPSGTAFTLHEDEGDSTFHVTHSDGCAPPALCEQWTIEIAGRPRGYIVRLLVDSVSDVALDGTSLPRVDSFAGLESAESGWFFDASAGRVWAKFETLQPAATLLVVR